MPRCASSQITVLEVAGNPGEPVRPRQGLDAGEDDLPVVLVGLSLDDADIEVRRDLRELAG